MLVGIDFDNTIVCYDALFYRLASERGLVPAHLPATKSHVRDHLRQNGREPDWTELQGIAYGPRIVDADPFPGIKEFLMHCRDKNVSCVIISHKTRFPYLGEPHDLHDAAHRWLGAHGFYEMGQTGLSPRSVHLALTKEDKLRRIGDLNCDVFIDDLPEFLGENSFPSKPKRVLFDPSAAYRDERRFARAESWAQIADIIFASGEGT